jgi:hypothetical protein
MALSNMSSREKIVVGVLGIVILLALIGIGVLAANLVSRSGEKQEVAGESATAAAVEGEDLPAGGTEATSIPGAPTESEADITPVATPLLREAPAAGAGDGEVVVRQEGVGPLAPVVIADQPLLPGRRYRIEIQAVDGSRVAIHGSWSQAAVGGGGTLSAPTIEFFEGQTPHRIDLALPLAEAEMWSCSVSAALQVGQSASLSGPALAIEIRDVTDD